ncbi:MAG: hypothetical protein H0T18_03110 [Chloroflexia bacterium]|nr:hypothetical protein [Chloroflexia bacterium]
MIRRSILALTVAGALAAGWTGAVEAQQNGIVIENNGTDVAASDAGADGVRISRAPGNSSSVDASGANNEVARAARGDRKRDRQAPAAPDTVDGGGEAAPVEEYVAPVDESLQAYTDDGTYVDPAAAPADAVAAPQVVALPSTGSGLGGSLPLTAVFAGLTAVLAMAASRRHRLIG